MQLPQPFIRLALTVDADRLRTEIGQFGRAEWRDHPQKHPGNAALPLVAVCARPQLRACAHANESTWGCFPAQSSVASLRDRVIRT